MARTLPLESANVSGPTVIMFRKKIRNTRKLGHADPLCEVAEISEYFTRKIVALKIARNREDPGKENEETLENENEDQK